MIEKNYIKNWNLILKNRTKDAKKVDELLGDVASPQTLVHLVSRYNYHLGLGTHDVGSNACQDKNNDLIHQSS